MSIHIPEYSIDIRPVGEHELKAVLRVYQQCEDFLALGPLPTASMETVLKDMQLSGEQRGFFCGIYTAEDGIVGILDYVPRGYEGDVSRAFIELLMIAAPYRGRGIGEAVVEALEQEVAKDPAVEVIEAGVQANNPGAVRFWQREGYLIVSGPQLMPDGTTAYGLRKQLRNRQKADGSGFRRKI